MAKSSKKYPEMYKDMANLLAWVVELDDRIEALENKTVDSATLTATWTPPPHYWTCTCAPAIDYKTGALSCTCDKKKKGAKK
jgi:hypothetical protein